MRHVMATVVSVPIDSSARLVVVRAVVAVPLAMVLFGTLNWLSVETKSASAQVNHRTLLAVAGFTFFSALYLAARFPVVALFVGVIMLGLVILGGAISGASDAYSRTSTVLPGEVLRHGAYMPLVMSGAMALLGVSCAHIASDARAKGALQD